MRKIIITGMAIAMLAIPAVASADVQRYQSQTATFTMTQPANEYNQWVNVWTHDFKVSVNPCDSTFSGTGHQFGHDANGDYTGEWTIAGKFNADNTVTFTGNRNDSIGNLDLSLTNAPMDSTTETTAALTFNGSPLSTPQPVMEKLTAPKFTNTSSYKNHGEFVKQSADKNDAAHSCIGMPINSSK